MRKIVCSFEQLREELNNKDAPVILFGAGAIGQVVAPEILFHYGLFDKITCYIDNDQSKWDTKIDVKDCSFPIKSPEYLKECQPDAIILINISRYAEVLEQLDIMECTRNMTGLIMPMFLIHNFCYNKSEGQAVKSSEPLIPAKIHYIWVGKKDIPYNLGRCIESWREYNPNYEIIRWDESNYDFFKHPYMKQAFECGAYGFVPDYARLDILYNEGGFYFDTDVVMKKSLDDLRYQEAFCGLEKWQIINFGGGSGAIKGHPMLKKFLDARKDILYMDENGKQNRNTCGFYDTQTALKEGYMLNGKTQNVQGLNIYAFDYFHPYDYMSGITNETDNTFSIHLFNGGWMDDNMKEQNRLAAVRYNELYEKCLSK